MYRIANISFGKSTLDNCYRYTYQGKEFEVQRFGAHFSIPYMKELIRTYRSEVDAVAISDLPPVMRLGGKSYVHHQALDIMAMPLSIPLCDGYRLKELATVNQVATLIQNGELDPKGGIFFPLSLFNLEVIQYLKKDYEAHLKVGDGFSMTGLPFLFTPSDSTIFGAQLLLNLTSWMDIERQTPMASGTLKRLARRKVLRELRGVRTVLSDIGVLKLFGRDADFVHGKDILLTSSNPILENELRQFEPRSIKRLIPKELDLSPFMNYPVLDATLRLALERDTALSLEEWQDILATSHEIRQEAKRYFLTSRPSPQSRIGIQVQKTKNRVFGKPTPDFAFVVHALSNEDLFRIPGLRNLHGLPEHWKGQIERTIAKAPGFTYGYVNNIVSEKNGREVNGIIYALPATPKMMKEEDPEVTYRKIESLCQHAAESGAKIMGLGAYIKIVGDSGASIHRNSPIPVTTGNSLSASATLWAVNDAVTKMGLLKKDPLTGLTDGTAMVIGATGSIGKVSAKLLSLVFNRLILVAPRQERLTELALEIEKISPKCQIVISTDANVHAHEIDVMVTATSAFDQKIIEIERLKPGCVVCDCSRPLDFSEEDAIKRPDVLIIESGEVVLPGKNFRMTCDLGLPDNSVYACLGETALLAMEGLYEPYTLGREIDWKKVKRIYRLAVEHGVKLAAIRGHAGFVSDREIQIVRNLALSGRSSSR